MSDSYDPTRGTGPHLSWDPAQLLEQWEQLCPKVDASADEKLAEAARLLVTAPHVTVRASPYVTPGESWVVLVPSLLGVPEQLLVLTDPDNVEPITQAVAALRRCAPLPET